MQICIEKKKTSWELTVILVTVILQIYEIIICWNYYIMKLQNCDINRLWNYMVLILEKLWKFKIVKLQKFEIKKNSNYKSVKMINCEITKVSK